MTSDDHDERVRKLRYGLRYSYRWRSLSQGQLSDLRAELREARLLRLLARYRQRCPRLRAERDEAREQLALKERVLAAHLSARDEARAEVDRLGETLRQTVSAGLKLAEELERTREMLRQVATGRIGCDACGLRQQQLRKWHPELFRKEGE